MIISLHLCATIKIIMSDHSDQNELLSDIDDFEQRKPKYDPRTISTDKREQLAALLEDKRTWGKDKARYHKDDQSSENDEEDEQAEAIEAEFIAKREQAKYLQDDYWEQFEDEMQDEPEQEDLQTQQAKTFNKVALGVISKELKVKESVIQEMSPKDLGAALSNVWPEVPEILKFIDIYSKKLQGITFQKTNTYSAITKSAYASYLSLLLFYIQLRFKTQLSSNHPIYQKLVQQREMIRYVEEMDLHVRLLDSHRQETLKKITKPKVKEPSETQQVQAKKKIRKPKKSKKQTTANKAQEKTNRALKVDRMLDELDADAFTGRARAEEVVNEDEEDVDDLLLESGQGGEDDFYLANKENNQQEKQKKKSKKLETKAVQYQEAAALNPLQYVEDEQARKINYIMLKKKSLMQRRRGTRHKNSRVKHKLRYDKALQKLKTQGKFTKQATSQFYQGEKGVKANQIKGVKLS